MTEEEIFAAALEKKTPQERAAFLDSACAGDGALRRRIEALLASDQHAGSFLHEPPPGVEEDNLATLTMRAADAATDDPGEGIGTRIGPYRLIEKIGEGAMGVIYMAEQEQPVRRRVAVKVVKPGMDSRQIIARFQAERQALALMNHPNIAAVYDAGMTARRRPYFVMELVKGVPITQFCDENRLTPRQRLELFIPVCQAIQHAHQKGIIHRDIKPSNVLVACYDDRPVPKVIDYGVAKALGPSLVEDAAVTAFGGIIGTLQYMSPEQATFNALDIDTRSDVYGLGALLYELLTGSPPLKEPLSEKAAVQTLLDVIRETDPPQPSARLSTTDEKALTSLAARRKIEPAALGRTFRGELDLIVMKALHKDRSQRYDSASGLARDISKYLTGEAVEACPPTLRYRVGKVLRRHKRSAIAAALVLLSLIAGVIGTSWGLVRARQARNAEGKQRVVAENALVAEATQHQAAEREKKAAQESEGRARENARKAQIRLAEGLVASGDAFGLANRLVESRRDYQAAYAQFLEARENPLAAQAAFLASLAASPPALSTCIGHTELPLCVAMGADGRTAISGGLDNTVRVWDLPTGRLIRTLAGHTERVTGVAISADGRTAISGGWDKKLLHWRLATGEILHMFAGHSDVITGVAMSADGRIALSGGYDRTLRVWDLEKGEHKVTLAGDGGWITSVALSPDGRSALSGSYDRLVKLWDIESAAVKATFHGHADSVTAVAFGPDAKTALSASETTLKLWDLGAAKEKFTLTGHTERVTGIAISPGGRTALSSSDDKTIRRWDLKTGKEVAVIGTRARPVSAVAVSADGQTALAASDDNQLKLWDLRPAPDVRTLPAVQLVHHLALSPDGRIAVSGGVRGIPEFWDVPTGKKLRSLGPQGVGVTCIAIAPDGRSVYIGLGDNSIGQWDFLSGQETRRLIGHKGWVTSIVFTGDGQTAFSGSMISGEVKKWDLRDPAPKPIALLACNGVPDTVAISPDCRGVASASTALGKGQTALTWWNLQGGHESRTLGTQSGFVDRIVISPDGNSALAGGFTRALNLWDLHGTRPLISLQGHRGMVRDVAFGPDSRFAFSSSNDQTVKIWDLAALREIRTLGGYPGEVFSVAVSRDGRVLLSGTAEGAIKAWDFSRVARHLELQQKVSAAKEALREHPQAPGALAVLGEWYAFEKKNDWAVELLEQARTAGIKVDPLMMARCYWELADDPSSPPIIPRQTCLARAKEAFAEAIAASKDGGERFYLQLCSSAVDREAADGGAPKLSQPISTAASTLPAKPATP